MSDLAAPDPLLDRRQLAEWFGVDVDTVKGWDERGRGPRRCVLGHRTIRYRRSDVEAWLEERATPNRGEVA